MDSKEFWRVFHEHLEMVAGMAGKSSRFLLRVLAAGMVCDGNASSAFVTEKELQGDEEDGEELSDGTRAEPGCDVVESGDVGVLFLEQLKFATEPKERTDFPNFRNLLWKSMVQFSDRVEPRSRELSPLLLRFIRSVQKQLDGTLTKAVL